jgi:predicted PurR-regulated permease PerM
MPTPTHRRENISFYILFAILGATVLFMFSPFFKLIALGGILAVLFTPLKVWVSKSIKSETASSLITFILAVLIILIPVYIIGQLVFNEVASVYGQASHSLMNLSQSGFMGHLPPSVQTAANDFLSNASQKITDLAGNAFQGITSIISNIAGFILSTILVMFALYYFLRDGKRFRSFVEEIFPLSHNHEIELVERLESAIKGVVQGSFTVALLQGSVSTIGFFIFGVPQPILWGVFTVMAALVPTVGTLLSLVPAILYLFLTGHVGAAVGMFIWAFASIQSIDNFISPRVIGNKVHLHPLVTLLSILGGIGMFGYLGFLLGPILVSMFMAVVDIYRNHVKTAPSKKAA